MLENIDHHPIREVSGTSVVMGLGHALAPSLAGSHGQIVFIEHRHLDDREVREGTQVFFHNVLDRLFDFFCYGSRRIITLEIQNRWTLRVYASRCVRLKFPSKCH